jgi:DNA-binding SARP family transcriptional activator
VRAPLAYLAASAPDAVRTALRNLRADSSRGVRDVARALLASVPIPPATDVRIEVLGATRLLQDGVATDDPNWRRQRVRQLVCALVAHRELRRARLGALLWPDADADAVSANLRMTLSYTQSLLEPERVRGDAAWFLRQDAGLLRLEGGRHLSVDAWEVEEHLDAAQRAASAGTPSVELDHLLSAVALWQGDYLDDVAGEEWAEPLRERFRHRFVSGAARAAELLGAAGRAAEAERVAVVAIGVDPYAEAAHRSLVRARLSTGDRDGARRAYDACVRRLAELGAGPEPTTAALARDFV